MTFHYWFIISLSLDSSVFLQPWSVHSNYSYSVVIYLQSGNNCIIFITQMMAPVTGKCISPSLRKLWKNSNKSIYGSILPLWHLYRNCGLCYMHHCSSFVNMVKYARLKGNMPLNFLSKMCRWHSRDNNVWCDNWEWHSCILRSIWFCIQTYEPTCGSYLNSACNMEINPIEQSRNFRYIL